MYGFQDLASQQQQRFWYYQGTTSGSFQTWNKPPGISFINIICVGGAGGGGGGTARRPSATTIGATGGATGAMTTVTLPAWNIPDTLYILPGYGGTGGTRGLSGSAGGIGTSGTSGTPSYVCFYPNTSSGYVLSVANGGGAGLFGGGGNSTSTAGAAALTTAYPTAQIGLRTSIIGSNYLASTGATVTAVYRITAGGGNSSIIDQDRVGGTIQPAGELFRDVVGGVTAGSSGMEGMIDLQKFISYGGTSGYSSVTQNGGLSGNGGPGSGGAGGAYGFLTGSNGGRGGDGFVIITCG